MAGCAAERVTESPLIRSPEERARGCQPSRHVGEVANLVTASDCMMVQPREPPRLLQRLCRLASSCPLAAFIYLTRRHFHPNSGAEVAGGISSYAFWKSLSSHSAPSAFESLGERPKGCCSLRHRNHFLCWCCNAERD
jgi:hypothetical protein